MSSLAEELHDVAPQRRLIGPVDTVRRTGVDAKSAVFDQVDCLGRGIVDGHDLIVVPMSDQDWYLKVLEIFGEVGFGELGNAVVDGGESCLHAQTPEFVDEALGDGRPFAIETIERQSKVLPEG